MIENMLETVTIVAYLAAVFLFWVGIPIAIVKLFGGKKKWVVAFGIFGFLAGLLFLRISYENKQEEEIERVFMEILGPLMSPPSESNGR